MKHQRIVHWLVIFLGLLISTGSSLKAQEFQKFDLRVSELSGTPIQDIPPKVERLEGDLKSRLDSEGVGEILVYTFAPRTTKDSNGVFVLEISSFSPLVEVSVNQDFIRLQPETYASSLKFDYSLAPGENEFKVRINSDSEVFEKIFKIFLETEEVKYQDPSRARKSKFDFISVAGVVRDDNISGTSKSPEVAIWSNLTLVGIGQIATSYHSALVLTGIIHVDDQWDNAHASREILFRQVNADWNDPSWVWGNFTVGLGHTQIGLRDPAQISKYRDLWNDSYRQEVSETFVALKLQVPVKEELRWTTSMRYGLQSKPGEKEKTKVSKLGQVLNFQYLDLPWSWSGEYSLVDTPTDSKDSKDISTALQFKIPIEPIKLGLELSFAESQRKSADNITKIRQKSTKTAGALLVAYPISAKMILEFSHRYEVQQTNNPGFDYHKNVDMLNFILIF